MRKRDLRIIINNNIYSFLIINVVCKKYTAHGVTVPHGAAVDLVAYFRPVIERALKIIMLIIE